MLYSFWIIGRLGSSWLVGLLQSHSAWSDRQSATIKWCMNPSIQFIKSLLRRLAPGIMIVMTGNMIRKELCRILLYFMLLDSEVNLSNYLRPRCHCKESYRDSHWWQKGRSSGSSITLLIRRWLENGNYGVKEGRMVKPLADLERFMG